MDIVENGLIVMLRSKWYRWLSSVLVPFEDAYELEASSYHALLYNDLYSNE